MYHKPGASHLSKIHKMLKGAGYKSDAAQDKAAISDAIHKHEKHDHPGKALTKLKSGGTADGKKSHHRLDKASRGKKPNTKVNVIVAQGKQPVPVPVPRPVPVPVRQALNAPTNSPMPMTPAGASPVPGQPPMKKGGKVGKYAKGGKVDNPGGGLTKLPSTPTDEPDTMPEPTKKRGGGACYKKGGAVKMTAGALSGEGRLEKSEIQEEKRKGK